MVAAAMPEKPVTRDITDFEKKALEYHKANKKKKNFKKLTNVQCKDMVIGNIIESR